MLVPKRDKARGISWVSIKDGHWEPMSRAVGSYWAWLPSEILGHWGDGQKVWVERHWSMDGLHFGSYHPSLAAGKSCGGNWPMLLASHCSLGTGIWLRCLIPNGQRDLSWLINLWGRFTCIEVDPWVQSQYGLQSKFQDSKGWTCVSKNQHNRWWWWLCEFNYFNQSY